MPDWLERAENFRPTSNRGYQPPIATLELIRNYCDAIIPVNLTEINQQTWQNLGQLEPPSGWKSSDYYATALGRFNQHGRYPQKEEWLGERQLLWTLNARHQGFGVTGVDKKYLGQERIKPTAPFGLWGQDDHRSGPPPVDKILDKYEYSVKSSGVLPDAGISTLQIGLLLPKHSTGRFSDPKEDYFYVLTTDRTSFGNSIYPNDGQVAYNYVYYSTAVPSRALAQG